MSASPPQQPLNVDGNDFPEFYSRTCTDLSAMAINQGGESRIDGMKAILTRASLMWENGKTITVGFVNPVPGTPIQQGKVKEVVKEWEAVANLKFQFIPNGKDANIRVGFRTNYGSWSYIGKGALNIARNEQTMNLGWVYSKPEITAEERGVILHEFGHAIGFLHEHQSPRRGEKLTLNEAVIIEQLKRTQRPPWTEEQTRQNVLNVYSEREVSNFSEVDFTSIMMYFMPKEWNVQGIEIKPNNALSPLDKAFAFLNYPFIGVASSDASVNLVNAMNTVGLTGSYRASIAAEFAEGDWEGVRAEFTRWAVNYKALADKAAAVEEREAVAAAVPAAAVVAVAA